MTRSYGSLRLPASLSPENVTHWLCEVQNTNFQTSFGLRVSLRSQHDYHIGTMAWIFPAEPTWESRVWWPALAIPVAPVLGRCRCVFLCCVLTSLDWFVSFSLVRKGVSGNTVRAPEDQLPKLTFICSLCLCCAPNHASKFSCICMCTHVYMNIQIHTYVPKQVRLLLNAYLFFFI